MATGDTTLAGPAGEEQGGRKGDRTRRRLLECAITRFADDGFRRTSVSEIARDVGVSPAAVYAYFPGKEALFRAAVDADAAALIEAALARAGDRRGRERWFTVLAALQERVADHPLARRVLAGHEPDVTPQLVALPSLANLRADLTAELAAAQRAGDVRADVDPAAIAWGLESLVLAVLMAHVQVGIDEPARAAGVRAVLDAALRPPP